GMRAVDTNGMQTMTRQWLAAEPELKLQLRIARNVPFAEVRGLLQSAAEAGATRIIYSAFQK
ncbi:MAG: hypothetical protein LR015_07060, partial [Verrucomicrobia bacterium]|nr:hypothetical protein [Verrucomicrobiota bacterium]